MAFTYALYRKAQRKACANEKLKSAQNEHKNESFYAYENVMRLSNQRTNGPVNAHLSLLHIPINMFEYYGI